MNNLLKELELIKELNNASELYYNGKDSFLTDKEFDNKLEELKKLEKETNIVYANSPTVTVGAKVLTGLNKVQITDKPMLSLEKVHTEDEIISFSDGYDLIASIKCDGLSVRLIYENGELSSANTRGTGLEGSDITEHIKHFLNVPLKINKKGRYIIDGEAIIYDKDFEIVNKNNEFKNNRNTASGALALLDMSIVANRRLSFIAWDIIEGGCSEDYYHYNLEEAAALGFTIVPALALDCTKVEKDEIYYINTTLLSEAKEKGIPCDGVVWKINDIKPGNEKGRTAHHFLNAVAWKPKDEAVESYLQYIDYDVSRTGQLTPVAVFSPVTIDGTVVERASLHNLSIMREMLGLYPEKYEKIWVIKANQIIPQIIQAEKNDILHDHVIYNDLVYCPICGSQAVVKISDAGVRNWFCPNEQCEGKLAQRIDHFCGKKGLDIKGISRATIEKLIDWGWLNGLADIFKLDRHRTEWISKTGFGEVSVGKILNNIASTRAETDFISFISALGIPLVGRTIAKEISKYYETWDDFRNAVGDDWSCLDGFGPEISRAINKFDYTEADEIAGMVTFKQPEVQPEIASAAAIKDKSFCVTGKLVNYTRDSIKSEIESLGGKVTSSVTSKTDYLITNTPDSGTSKNRDAQKLGIPIITEVEYIKMKS